MDTLEFIKITLVRRGIDEDVSEYIANNLYLRSHSVKCLKAEYCIIVYDHTSNLHKFAMADTLAEIEDKSFIADIATDHVLYSYSYKEEKFKKVRIVKTIEYDSID